MLSENEALQKVGQLSLCPAKMAWAGRMITQVAKNAIDRELLVAYVTGVQIRDEAAEALRSGALVDGKRNPAHTIYNAEITKLTRLAKLLKMFGVTPFEGA